MVSVRLSYLETKSKNGLILLKDLFLAYGLGYPKYLYLKLKYKNTYKILSYEETWNYVIKNSSKIARLGDGELSIAFSKNKGKGALYQDVNDDLRKKLLHALSKNGIDDGIGVIDYLDLKSTLFYKKIFFLKQILKHGGRYCKSIKGKTWLNAEATRYYWELKDDDDIMANNVERLVTKLLTNKRILLIEGKYSNFCLGFEPIANATLVNRILVPPTNAYSYYEDIVKAIKEETLNNKYDLILVACGATATVIVDQEDFGVQTLDIGNIDSEFGWHKVNAKIKKVELEGKNLMEVSHVHDLPNYLDTTNVVKIIG